MEAYLGDSVFRLTYTVSVLIDFRSIFDGSEVRRDTSFDYGTPTLASARLDTIRSDSLWAVYDRPIEDVRGGFMFISRGVSR